MEERNLRIFVRVVKIRMDQEGRTAADILTEYPRLTTDEREAILQALVA